MRSGRRTRSPVQRGGAATRAPGVRAVPSLMYMQNVPPFTEHFFDSDGDDSIDQGPAGGRTWDGRAQSAHDQARVPLFSPFEMANREPRRRRRPRSRARPMRRNFARPSATACSPTRRWPSKACCSPSRRSSRLPRTFYPYTSKYDAYLRREAALSSAGSARARGFQRSGARQLRALSSERDARGAFPQFTDFGYAALGVPRNPAIPANADPRYYDLGLCGPLRTDLKDGPGVLRLVPHAVAAQCGAQAGRSFTTASFTGSRTSVRFYAERDTAPQKWYPGRAGRWREFDDLPARYRSNLDRQPPFDRHRGEKPALTDRDIRDIVAFLNTLTDGYTQRRDATLRAPASASR